VDRDRGVGGGCRRDRGVVLLSNNDRVNPKMVGGADPTATGRVGTAYHFLAKPGRFL
jgi:hypothetical protein